MKLLVTGGGGFLGQALCRGLVARGHEVASFNRGHYPELEALGVRQHRGDLADAGAVLEAARGCDAIFHNAAKAGAWGGYDGYYRANVLGTRHVLAACRAHGIDKLVYTSTPSVTHRRTHPVAGGTYAYARAEIGPWTGFIAGWCFVIGKIASCAATASTATVVRQPSGAA